MARFMYCESKNVEERKEYIIEAETLEEAVAIFVTKKDMEPSYTGREVRNVEQWWERLG
jgi:hypothetical protein